MPREHNQNATNYNSSFALSITLNSIFMIFEVIDDITADSMTFITNADHNLKELQLNLHD